MVVSWIKSKVINKKKVITKRNDSLTVVYRDDFDDTSNEAYSLKALLNNLKLYYSNLGDVVILGSGEGEWTQVIAEDCSKNSISSYLWWDRHERPALKYHNSCVTVVTHDVRTARAFKCTTLLSNIVTKDARQELEDLCVFARWLEFKPENFMIRITNYSNNKVVSQLKKLKKICRGHLVGVGSSNNPKLGQIDEVYFVPGRGRICYESKQFSLKMTPSILQRSFDHSNRHKQLKASWPIPDALPVEHLAPLDMGNTLKRHPNLCQPKNNTIFYKELGWYQRSYYNHDLSFNEPVFVNFIEPLQNLIEGYDNWDLTANNADAIDETFHAKLDRAPEENHCHHERLWEAYQAIAAHLRAKNCLLSKLKYDELEPLINRHASMGVQEQDLGFNNLGEYISSELWQPNVEEFKLNLMNDKPIKADFYASGKREQKREGRTRIVWSLCATARLYEAIVFAKVDDLLHELPYTVSRLKAYNNGQVFDDLLKQSSGERVAICDDISGWDTRVSYSMLCMEAAFLQSLTDDEEHKREIKQLYRLYAFAVVNIPRIWDEDGSPHNVLYQLQGQVISGRRVTYSMNTITNIVVNMCRAAESQKIKVKDTQEWISKQLAAEHSSSFGGKISGDDTVIVLGAKEASEFASSVKMMNEIGLIRKGTGSGCSKVVKRLSGVNFCSRNFVKVPMYWPDNKEVALYRYIPIKRVDEILMRKLLREDDRDTEQSWAWAREQARDLLVEHFHVPTLRYLALAILSCTPRGIILDDNDKGWSEVLGSNFTVCDIVRLLNDRLFGKDAMVQDKYKAEKLADFGFISKKDAETYDLNLSAPEYRDWMAKLRDRTMELRVEGKDYDDWLELHDFDASSSSSCFIN